MRSKKIMLLKLLIFIIFIPLSNVGIANTQDNEMIKLSISLEKASYLMREPIWLEISAINITDTDIVIFPLIPECLGCIEIVLKNSQSNSLGYEGMINEYTPGCPHGALTEPDKVVKDVYNLLDGFGERVNNWGIRHYLKPDKYTVQVLYLNKVSSNILEFRVEAPQGEEEKAYQLLTEGISYLFYNQREKLVEKLKELITEYPKSVYADLAYYEMFYWDQNKVRAKENAKKLILKNPDSKYVINALWKLLSGEDKETRKKILKEWIGKIPGTKAEEWAKGALKTIESKKD